MTRAADLMSRITVDAFAPLRWQKLAARAILRPTGGTYAWAGGKGSGKSLLLCWLAVMLAYLRPGAEIALVMDTHKSLRDIHLPFLMQLAPSVGGVWRAGDLEWHFPNGSVIRMRHLEMAGDPMMGGSPVEGGNYHAVLMDEGQKVDARYWMVFLERARVAVLDLAGNLCAPLVITSGLPIGTWWCAETARAGGLVLRPQTRDNTHNDAGYEGRLRAAMTEARARAMLDGEEYTPEGAIYQEFVARDEADGGNLSDRVLDYARCRTALIIDPGVNRPFATLAAQDLESKVWYLAANWAPDGDVNGVSVSRLASIILRDCVLRAGWKQGGKPPIDEVWMDPAGRSRSQESARPQLEVWGLPPPEGIGQRPRINTDPSRVPVMAGIQRTQLAFERKRLMMLASLYRKCMSEPPTQRNLARCLLGYRWDPRHDGEPLKGDGNDDGADTVRYLVMAMPDLWHIGTVSHAAPAPPREAPARDAYLDHARDVR